MRKASSQLGSKEEGGGLIAVAKMEARGEEGGGTVGMGKIKGRKSVKVRGLVAREGVVEEGGWAGDENWEFIFQLN